MSEEIDFSRARVGWGDRLRVDDLDLPVETIIAHLREHLTPERLARLTAVIDRRSLHVVSVLENIYDRGNVSAVMRSAEAFGFMQMYLVDRPGARFKAANRITRGAEKWLDVRQFHDPVAAVRDLQGRGFKVWATDLNTEHAIDAIDWTQPTAVVLGNEKDGTSPEMLAAVDGRFKLPMLGFSQSYNISVAAALIFYHAHLKLEPLGAAARLGAAERTRVLANYLVRCFDNPAGILRAHERG